jgi:hypothetical protein
MGRATPRPIPSAQRLTLSRIWQPSKQTNGAARGLAATAAAVLPESAREIAPTATRLVIQDVGTVSLRSWAHSARASEQLSCALGVIFARSTTSRRLWRKPPRGTCPTTRPLSVTWAKVGTCPPALSASAFLRRGPSRAGFVCAGSRALLASRLAPSVPWPGVFLPERPPGAS